METTQLTIIKVNVSGDATNSACQTTDDIYNKRIQKCIRKGKLEERIHNGNLYLEVHNSNMKKASSFDNVMDLLRWSKTSKHKKHT